MFYRVLTFWIGRMAEPADTLSPTSEVDPLWTFAKPWSVPSGGPKSWLANRLICPPAHLLRGNTNLSLVMFGVFLRESSFLCPYTKFVSWHNFRTMTLWWVPVRMSWSSFVIFKKLPLDGELLHSQLCQAPMTPAVPGVCGFFIGMFSYLEQCKHDPRPPHQKHPGAWAACAGKPWLSPALLPTQGRVRSASSQLWLCHLGAYCWWGPSVFKRSLRIVFMGQLTFLSVKRLYLTVNVS